MNHLCSILSSTLIFHCISFTVIHSRNLLIACTVFVCGTGSDTNRHTCIAKLFTCTLLEFGPSTAPGTEATCPWSLLSVVHTKQGCTLPLAPGQEQVPMWGFSRVCYGIVQEKAMTELLQGPMQPLSILGDQAPLPRQHHLLTCQYRCTFLDIAEWMVKQSPQQLLMGKSALLWGDITV